VYSDETLTCVDCGREFVFTSGEQEFYALKGFQNKPNRCADCRAARKASRGQGGGGGRSGGAREMFRSSRAATSRCIAAIVSRPALATAKRSLSYKEEPAVSAGSFHRTEL
jgi:hypothetical protein